MRNSSQVCNHSEWNRVSRFNAAQQIGKGTRIQPTPQESMELDPQIRVIPPIGSILVFPGAQMHSTVPNTPGQTRFSIDFRTVYLDDVISKRGALNIDSACTGTSLGNFRRATDLARIPTEWIAAYDTPPAKDGSHVRVPRSHAIGIGHPARLLLAELLAWPLRVPAALVDTQS